MKRHPIIKKVIFFTAKYAIIVFLVFNISGCNKFLDKQKNKNEIIPTALKDLQSLLNNNEAINGSGPALLELVSDNYYVTSADWNANSNNTYGQHYTWLGSAVPEETSWTTPYQQPIYHSNVVLDQLSQIKFTDSEKDEYNVIRGSCLFYRSFYFHLLAQLFCKPYSIENVQAPGLVLRLSSNLADKLSRSNVGQTYERIIIDLKEAAELLPATSRFPTRPSKIAAYGILARTYLSMRQYDSAGRYANLALLDYDRLIDFNDLIPIQFPPISTFNPEVIYHNYSTQTYFMSEGVVKIDSNLYNSYDNNDLRKHVFFRENQSPNERTFAFQGSYHGTNNTSIVFDGLTTAELLLVRAETYARSGKVTEAMADLNMLIKKRWDKNAVYPEITAADQNDALNKILTERRKELVFRGLRWSDIRRLNLEGANITLKRVIDDKEYILPPNDLRSVMLISQLEITRGGIEQNER